MKCKPIAICGTIGSGKSTVGDYLRSKGFVVVDCDKIAKEVSNSQEVLSEVEKLLGSDFLQDGQLNRKKIRQFVFSKSEILKEYNNIFFERTKLELEKKLQNHSGIVFVEIPLLHAFEFDWYEVWEIQSTKQLQIERVAIRDNVDTKDVENVLSRQSEAKCPTHILENFGELKSLFAEVDRLAERLKNL